MNSNDLETVKNYFIKMNDWNTLQEFEYVRWLINQAEKLELLKIEIERGLRDARNLDETDVAFELGNLLDLIEDK